MKGHVKRDCRFHVAGWGVDPEDGYTVVNLIGTVESFQGQLYVDTSFVQPDKVMKNMVASE